MGDHQGAPDTGEYPRWLRVLGSVLWGLVPVATIGFGTPVIMVMAAIKKRSWIQGVLSLGYCAALGLEFAFDPDNGDTSEVIFGVCVMITVAVACIHAFIIRTWVFDLAPVTQRAATRRSVAAQQEAALKAADQDAAAREKARQVVAERPRLALRLQIGRRDLGSRSFPDGGLVDVNHVPAETLARFTDLSEQQTQQIVATRDRIGGFSSVNDLSVTMDLPPRALDPVADLLVFLPLTPTDTQAPADR